MDDDKKKYAGKPGYDENGEIDWSYLETDRANLMPIYMIVKMPCWLTAYINIEAKESNMTSTELINQILALAVVNLKHDRRNGGLDMMNKMIKNDFMKGVTTCKPDSEYSEEERELELKYDSVKWLHEERKR